MRVLVIAPHPDDETLGCGGTLLRRKLEGAELGWLIVTGISEQAGWPTERVKKREAEIASLSQLVGFSHVYSLGFPTTQLDQVPISVLVDKFSSVFLDFQPEEIFLPHPSDVHSDHRVVFDVASACTKWFRYPSVRRVLSYETISETDFGLNPTASFQPNFFVDISEFLDKKIEMLAIYQSELGEFPFPRSIEAIRAQASLRGSTIGSMAAEAFQLLRERQ